MKSLRCSVAVTSLLFCVCASSAADITWRFRAGEVERAADPALNDSGWQQVSLPFTWPDRQWAWFRSQVEVPEQINGRPASGQPVALALNAADGGEVFVRGKLIVRFDNDHPALVLLTPNATPGERVPVALHSWSDGEKPTFGYCELRLVSRKQVDEPVRFTLDLAQDLGPLPRPFTCLSQGGGMPEYTDQVARMFREIGIKFFRMDHLTNVVISAIADGKATYNWEDADRRIEFIRSIGAEPIICLAYMPEPLRALPEKQFNSAPKDYTAWEEMVYQMVRRYNVEKRYAIKRWEVWNEPNAPGWFTAPPGETDLEAYLKLYEATARGVKRADPNAWVGGPALAGGPWKDWARGEEFMRGLIKFCAERQLPLDFISWHEYWHPPEQYRKEIELYRQWVSEYSGPKVSEYLITEWNFAWWHDRAQDNEVGAAWTANSLLRSIISNRIDHACFFLAMDFSQGWNGEWGMITRDRRPKAVYNVFRMFSGLGDRRLRLAGGNGEIAGIAASDPERKTITILLCHFGEQGDIGRKVRINLAHAPKTKWLMTRWLMDATHSNGWHDRAHEQLEQVESPQVAGPIEFTLPNNAVTLVELVPR